MTFLLSWTGLLSNDNATDPGARTERRGEAGPVRDLAWRLHRTGRLSLQGSGARPGFDPVPGLRFRAAVLE
jgi:hypothetical protein